MCVHYRVFTSFLILAISGVPQGTVVRPLLYILFINDIYQEIQNNVYAGDSKIFTFITCETVCVSSQEVISKISLW